MPETVVVGISEAAGEERGEDQVGAEHDAFDVATQRTAREHERDRRHDQLGDVRERLPRIRRAHEIDHRVRRGERHDDGDASGKARRHGALAMSGVDGSRVIRCAPGPCRSASRAES